MCSGPDFPLSVRIPSRFESWLSATFKRMVMNLTRICPQCGSYNVAFTGSYLYHIRSEGPDGSEVMLGDPVWKCQECNYSSGVGNFPSGEGQ